MELCTCKRVIVCLSTCEIRCCVVGEAERGLRHVYMYFDVIKCFQCDCTCMWTSCGR